MLCVTMLCGMLVACSKVESPETVISNVATDAIVTQFGQSTWQTTLKDHTVSDVQGAFVEAGYQSLYASIVDGVTNPPLVLTAKDTQITLYLTEDGVRVMWDSANRAAQDLLVPNDATGTGEVTMVQVGVVRNTTTDNPAIGMCYVYKLSDGRAVILDGGIAGNEAVVYQTLQKLDIAKDKQGKYQIAAWILSHGHQVIKLFLLAELHHEIYCGMVQLIGNYVRLFLCNTVKRLLPSHRLRHRLFHR